MSQKFRVTTVLAGLAIGALVLGACSSTVEAPASTASSEQVTELNVGVTPIANAAHLFIAVNEGFFAEEGLEVTPTIIQTPTTAIPSLLNNELQVALMTSVPIVTAASKGLPIQVVSGSDRYPLDGATDTTALAVAPGSGIESVGDLAGKTVALVGLKSAPELALRVVLEEAGVDPADVEVVEIAYPDMLPALEANRVDAAFIVDPFLSAAKAAGLTTISQPFTDGIGGMSALLWVGSDAFVGANPETMQKFAAAMKRAGEFANENPDAIRAVLPEFTSLPPEAIEKSILPVYAADVTAADIEAYVQLMTRAGFIEEGYDSTGLVWSPDGD